VQLHEHVGSMGFVYLSNVFQMLWVLFCSLRGLRVHGVQVGLVESIRRRSLHQFPRGEDANSEGKSAIPSKCRFIFRNARDGVFKNL